MGRKRKYNTENERKNAQKLAIKKYYEKNKEKLKLKRIDNYNKNKKYFIKKAMNWNAKNPKKVVESKRKYNSHIFKLLAYYANRRNKSLEIITPLELFSIAKKQKLKCALTEDRLTKENISVDHIVPISRGGKNEKSNIRLVIYDINMSKHNHTDKEFLELCKKVIKTLS